MARRVDAGCVLIATFAVLAGGLLEACTTSDGEAEAGGVSGGGANGTSGSAGAAESGGAGSANVAGAPGSSGIAGIGGTGGTPGVTETPEGGTDARGSTYADASPSDGTTSPPFDAAGRTPPTCKTPKPSPIASQKPTNECDYLLQSVDFEDQYSYPSPVDAIRITNFGSALGLYEVNNCSPYCFSKALTVGVDIVGGGDPKQLQGEVIIRFPATGGALPIATALGRDSLAWIMLDGPTAPTFPISAQLVVENATGSIPAIETKQLGYGNWLDYQHAEFKYFPVTDKTFSAPPVNLTGIGFRIIAPANLAKGQEWHGVVYLDHLQIRAGAPKDPPGQYPFGL